MSKKLLLDLDGVPIASGFQVGKERSGEFAVVAFMDENDKPAYGLALNEAGVKALIDTLAKTLEELEKKVVPKWVVEAIEDADPNNLH